MLSFLHMNVLSVCMPSYSSRKRWLWMLSASFLLVVISLSSFFYDGLLIPFTGSVSQPQLVATTTDSDAHQKEPLTSGKANYIRTNDDVKPHENADTVAPRVAWIMSFGGSGTSYTILNTEQMTGLTTATNYARDIQPSVPVRSEWTEGPFLHHPNSTTNTHGEGNSVYGVPYTYILTKTHCGGYCMDCAPNGYVFGFKGTADMGAYDPRFEKACRTGHKYNADEPTGQSTTYDASIPEKAIHLIRNPFDNMVGRMHLSSKLRQQQQMDNGAWEDSKAGLKEWCSYLDTKYRSEERAYSPELDALFERHRSLPCLSEWFRYVQWHNRAEQVTEHLNLPVYYLYYDNYTTNYDQTVSELFDFLELSPINSRNPLAFTPGKSYGSYFEEQHKLLARRFVRELASPKVWTMMQHFFLSSDDSNGISTQTNDNPQKAIDVAWLLSFPNSGTSYTITNTEHATNMSTASNYANDWEQCIPLRPDLAVNGPFMHDPTKELPRYVLTKTHCTGYCEDCAPRGYIVPSVDDFEKGCLSGHALLNGTVTSTQYDWSVPVKAIHLIRDPFDNIVARMHLAVKKRKREGWSDQELEKINDLDSWCDQLDNKYLEMEEKDERIPANIKEIWKDVPCHADFYRYVQWHNWALEMTNRLAKRRLLLTDQNDQDPFPVHYLFYEEYTRNYNKTVDDLFAFLHVEKAVDPLAFIPGKTYGNLYSEKAKRAAARLVQALATPECWELLKRYFEGYYEREL